MLTVRPFSYREDLCEAIIPTIGRDGIRAKK